MTPHGTRSRYVQGCRCEDCTRANAIYKTATEGHTIPTPSVWASVVRVARPLREEAWQRDAACKGMDPDLFHPVHDDAEAVDAKAVCAACPVRKHCLDYAMRNREQHGIWGGLNADERRSLRRRIQRRTRKVKGMLAEARA